MVNLQGEINVLEDKFIHFNNKFHIIPKENISDLVEELSELTNSQLQIHDRSDVLKMWDQISAQGSKFQFSSKIAMAVQSLPTSSAIVEQKFSTMKLVKTNLRNRLSESSLHSCLLIEQEYDQGFTITNEVIDTYWKIKEELYQRKNSPPKKKVQNPQKNFENNKQTVEENEFNEMVEEKVPNLERKNEEEQESIIKRIEEEFSKEKVNIRLVKDLFSLEKEDKDQDSNSNGNS